MPYLASRHIIALMKACLPGVLQFGFVGYSLSNVNSISYDWKFSLGIHHSSSQPTNLTFAFYFEVVIRDAAVQDGFQVILSIPEVVLCRYDNNTILEAIVIVLIHIAIVYFVIDIAQ